MAKGNVKYSKTKTMTTPNYGKKKKTKKR